VELQLACVQGGRVLSEKMACLLTKGDEITSVEQFTDRLREFITEHCKDALKSVLLSR
jgi:hypothetical protein